jgi:hypothetical protein
MQVKVWLLSAVALTVLGHTAEAQNGFIASLPFSSGGGNSIYLPVRINGGNTGWWALDSGASECIIDRSTARRAQLRTRGGRDLHGAGKGTVRLDSIRTPVSLQIGGRALRGCDHFGAVELKTANLDSSHPLTGILGYEFFARYIVRVDFANRAVTLFDPKVYRYTGTGDTLELELAKRVPRVQVRIRTANRPEVVRSLIVDTGSEDFVDDSTVRRSPTAPGVTVSTTGLGKSYEAVIGTLDTVRIGRSLLTGVPGVASEVGIVGNGIWSRFVCIFDFQRRLLILESR